MGPYKTKQQFNMVLYGFEKNIGKYKKSGFFVDRGRKIKGVFSPLCAFVRHRGGGKIRSGGASFLGGATCPERRIGAEGFPAPAGAWGFMSFSKLAPSLRTSLKIVKYHKSQQLRSKEKEIHI